MARMTATCRNKHERLRHVVDVVWTTMRGGIYLRGSQVQTFLTPRSLIFRSLEFCNNESQQRHFRFPGSWPCGMTAALAFCHPKDEPTKSLLQGRLAPLASQNRRSVISKADRASNSQTWRTSYNFVPHWSKTMLDASHKDCDLRMPSN